MFCLVAQYEEENPIFLRQWLDLVRTRQNEKHMTSGSLPWRPNENLCQATTTTANKQTWKTVSPWSSGILRNDSSRSRDTDDSIFASQRESVSCSRLNCSNCLTMSADDCMAFESRWQTFPHRVVMDDTCFFIRSESYWSVDLESSSARSEIFSSCGFRLSISPAIAC